MSVAALYHSRYLNRVIFFSYVITPRTLVEVVAASQEGA